MVDWRGLNDELDRWGEAGLGASLWWRDDDAAGPSPSLDRLLSLHRRTGAPLALAVIPARAEAATAERVAGEAAIDALQHGYAHTNHAPPDARKAELADRRETAGMVAELRDGWRRIERLFGDRALAVLVPPWNRIAAALVAHLGAAGYVGLSTYGARNGTHAACGVVQVNTHIDIIDWRGSRGFVGDDAALGMAIAHLAARRAGAADRDEPTGLLTHHLVHDAAAWRFVDTFIAATRGHAAARWIGAREAFHPSAGAAP